MPIGAAYWRPFPTAQLQLDRLTHEVGLAFTLAQYGLDTIKCALGKTRDRLILHWRATDRSDLARRHPMP